jgi:prepilin peptidase CpaA
VTPHPFFPNPAFAWGFYAILIGFLVVAAYIDLRRMRVPKSVSVSLFFLGMLANLARGAWMGSAESQVWHFTSTGTLLGMVDGFLFAAEGFFVCFFIFFALWTVGACGGGDVKIFAAVGTWVGPYIAIWVFCLSTLILVVLLTLKFAVAIVSPSSQAAPPFMADRKSKAPTVRDPRMARGLTYSLPLALATGLLLLWFFRVDLNLARPLATRAVGGDGYNNMFGLAATRSRSADSTPRSASASRLTNSIPPAPEVVAW